MTMYVWITLAVLVLSLRNVHSSQFQPLARCPLSCRCSRVRSDTNPRPHGASRDLRGNETYGASTVVRREMICVGLREIPGSIPADVMRLSVIGEEAYPAKITFDQSNGSSGIVSRGTRTESSNQLSVIHKSAFIGSLNLMELSVVGNDLQYISPAQFEFLPNLVSLNLRNNELRSLHARTFQGLVQLKELRLSNNELHRLPVDLLDDVPDLKELYLNGNQLRHLHIDAFRFLHQLRVLDLSSNNLTYLPRSLLMRNKRLNNVNLNDNLLTEIRSDWFDPSNELKKLSINRNKIEVLDSYGLGTFRRLNELSLSGNKISLIYDGTFDGLVELDVLDLSNNQISALRPKVFHKAKSLKTVSLAGNQLTVIPGDIFHQSSVLKVLDLSGNKINTVLKNNFQRLNRLQKLDLSRNQIGTIVNGTFSGLRRLRELNLAENNIAKVESGSFSVSVSRYISQLTWLNLQHNSIGQVSRGTFRTVPHLKFLNLAFNKIERLDVVSFASQKQLNTLLLNNNLIANLPNGVFSSLKNVRHLHLAYNRIRGIGDSSLKGLEKVSELNFQGNRLNKISDRALWESSLLTSANFSHNPLSYVSVNSFSQNRRLTHLDFSWNSISRFQTSLTTPLSLKFLSLVHNNLTTLHSDVSALMTSEGVLALSGNPWHCDCHLSWLKSLAPIWQLQLQEERKLVCLNPRELEGKRILSLSHSQFICRTQESKPKKTDVIGSSVLKSSLKINQKSHKGTGRPKPRQKFTPDLRKHVNRLGPKAVPYEKASPKILWNSKDNQFLGKTGRIRKVPPKPNFLPKQKTGKRYSQDQSAAEKKANAADGSSITVEFPDLVKNWLDNWSRPSTLTTTTQRTIRFSRRRHVFTTPKALVKFNQPPKSSIKKSTPPPTLPPHVQSRRTTTSAYETTAPPSPRNSINSVSQWWIPRPIYSDTKTKQPRSEPIAPNESKNSLFASTTTLVNWFPGTRRWFARPPAPPRPTSDPFWNRPIVAKDMRSRRQTSPSSVTNGVRTTNRWFVRQSTTPQPNTGYYWDRPNAAKDLKNSPYTSSTIATNRVRTTMRWVDRPPTTPRPGRGLYWNRLKPDKNTMYDPYTSPATLANWKRTTKRRFAAPTTSRPGKAPNRNIPQNRRTYTHLSFSNPSTSPPKAYTTLSESTRRSITLRPVDRIYNRKNLTSTPRSPGPRRKQNQPMKAKGKSSLSQGLECSTNPEWRMHFDTNLIRKHRSEVKNIHVTILNSRRRPSCNAVLLSDWWILTTASCVENSLANPGKIRDPSWVPNFNLKIGFRELNKAVEIRIHPMYNTTRSAKHNFALLKLKYESLMTKVAKTPCVLSKEWFQNRPMWVVPGVASARFDTKKPRSKLQTLNVKVWDSNCSASPLTCLRVPDRQLAAKTSFTEGAPLYIGYTGDRWSLVGLGTSSKQRSVNRYTQYLPLLTVMDWLKDVIRQ